MPAIDHRHCQFACSLRGAGIPVVLIQGVGLHGDGWLPQTDALTAAGCQTLTFDNRGMGRSQPATVTTPRFGAPISVEQMADDTLALMDAAGFSSAHLVGHSLGGLVATHIALTARPRVRSLALLCTFANGATALKLTPRMLWLGMRSRVGTRAARRNAFLQIVMSAEALQNADRPALAQKLAVRFGHDLADQPPIVEYQLKALKRYDATQRLADLAGIPTLIVGAAQDPISRPADAGRILHQKIPGSRYVEYPDAAHGLPLEFPERINTLLVEHFNSLGNGMIILATGHR